MHKFDAAFELFERIITRAVMLVLCLLTVYALLATGIELIKDLKLGSDFIEKELWQDTFGSILTVLILLEFTHSVFTSVKNRSVIIEARAIVLIAVIVVARKLILVDFKSVTAEQVWSYGGIALVLGILYWLLGSTAGDRHRPPPPAAQ